MNQTQQYERRERAEGADPRCECGNAGQPRVGGKIALMGVETHGDSKINLRDIEGALERLQFGTVHLGETGKHLLTRLQQMNLDLAAVRLTDLSADQIE